jgi:tape measure domain-containing protein
MPISLGDISFNLGADTRGLQRSVRDLQNFGRTVERAQASATSATDRTAAALRRQEKASTDALNATLRLSQGMRNTAQGSRYADQLARSFRDLNNQMTRGPLNALQYQRAMERFRASTEGTTRAFRDLNREQSRAQQVRGGGFFASMAKAATAVQGPLGGVASRISAFAGLMGTGGVAMTAFAGGFVAVSAAAYKFASSVLEAGKAMQQFLGQLQAVTGNLAQAEELFGKVQKIADKTGSSVQDLAPSFARLTVAASGTGLKMADVEKMFTIVSAAAIKLQLDSSDTVGIFRALEQMMSKGTIQAEELRGQLGDRLPGAFNIMARALGVTTSQLTEMMKKGEVLSASALPKFVDELSRTLNLGNGKITNYTASVNRFNNAWFIYRKEFDRAYGITAKMQSLWDKGAKILESSTKNIEANAESSRKLVDWIKAIDETMQPTAKAFSQFWINIGNGFKEMWNILTVTMRSRSTDFQSNWTGMINYTTDLIINFADAIPLLIRLMFQKIDYEMQEGIIKFRQGWADFFAPWAREGGILGSIATFFKPADLINPFKTAVEDTTKAVDELFAREHHVAEQTKKDWDELVKKVDKYTEARLRGESIGGQAPRWLRGLGPPEGKPFELEPAPPEAPKGLTDKEIRALERKIEAIKAIDDEMARLRDEIEALSGPQVVLDKLMKAFEREKAVEKYAKAMRKAGIDTEFVAKKSAELLALLERRDLLEKQRETLLELRDTFVTAFDDIAESILTVFEGGENAAQDFKKTVLKVINDILDEIIKLTLLNPLKNWLFGTDLPQLGGGTGFLDTLLKAIPGLGGGGGTSAKSTASVATTVANKVADTLSDTLSGAGGVETLAGGAGTDTLKNASSYINMINQGATRSLALAPKLSDALSFLGDMGLVANVYSGGQPSSGPGRVGSHRHDWGMAADVFFTRAGTSERVSDIGTMSEIVRRGKAAGLTGFGMGEGYMSPGTMHLGYGAPGVWGAGGKGANAPSWLREAFYGGGKGGDAAPAVTKLDELATSTKAVTEAQDTLADTTKTVTDAATKTTEALEVTVPKASQQVAQSMGTLGQGFQSFGNQLGSWLSSLGTGGGGNWWQDLLGIFGSSAAPTGAVTSSLASGWTTRLEVGGTVGNKTGLSKRVSPLAFIGAPSMASGGMVGDEVPIIAHRGERIIPRGRSAPGAVSGNAVSVNIHNYAGVGVQTASRQNARGQVELDVMIDRLVADKLQQRGSASNNTMRKFWGNSNTLRQR